VQENAQMMAWLIAQAERSGSAQSGSVGARP